MLVHLEDCKAGHAFASRARTITEADIVAFAGLSGDFNSLHIDREFAARQGFGRPVAHGALIYSVGTGLRSAMDDLEILAYLKIEREFVGPVFANDTVHVKYTITEVRPSRSKPDRGVVTFGVEVVNQDDVVVHRGIDVLLVSARPAG